MSISLPAPRSVPSPGTAGRYAPAADSPPQPTRVYLPALASAGLLWASYFPLAQGWLAWLALVPLLVLVRATGRARRVYLAAWLGGLAFFVPALQWIRVADPRMVAAWLALAFYCSLYVPLAVALLRRLDRTTRLPLVVTVPVVWVALEYLRSHLGGRFALPQESGAVGSALQYLYVDLGGGFAWYLLGHTQHAFLAVIQIADLTGVYGVSFLLAAVAALAFEAACTLPRLRRLMGLPGTADRTTRRGLRVRAVAVLLLVAGVVGYGAWRLDHAEFAAGPRVALLQGNLDQRVRNMRNDPAKSDRAIGTMMEHYGGLCMQAAARHPLADLIVWPETSYPFEWHEIAPDVPLDDVPGKELDYIVKSRRLLELKMRGWGTNVLLGLNSRVQEADGSHRYNSAVLLRADGTFAGRYDKIHCVPFGESVPLRETLPWLNRFAPHDNDYNLWAGRACTRFALPTPDRVFQFGVVICYEDTDALLARHYARGENGDPPVDFLVNISNDGWFDGTSEHEQHLAICRFRAVEARRAVLRAVNMGISAVIDGDGRVTALPADGWAASKKIEAVLTTAVPLDGRASPYARLGDWLPQVCWLGLAFGLLMGGLWKTRPAA